MKILKNKIFMLFMIIFILMFIIPLIIVKLFNHTSVLGCLILLLMIIYPIFSIVVGIIVGKNLKKLWYIPLIIFIIFPMLYWIVLETIEFDFYIYSFGYFVISSLVMVITHFINKKLIDNK